MISWWCVALQEPWSWRWIAYPGIWVAMAAPLVAYFRTVSRSDRPTTRRQKVQFLVGMLILWIATDWPLGTLGAGYLASAHMAQFLLYTLGAAPLLMLGTPDWMAERIIARLRLGRVARWLGGSLVGAGVIYNLMLVSTHAPGVVSLFRTSQVGSVVASQAARSNHTCGVIGSPSAANARFIATLSIPTAEAATPQPT